MMVTLSLFQVRNRSKVAEYDKLLKQIRDKIKFVPNAEKFLSLTAAPDSSAREDCARFS